MAADDLLERGRAAYDAERWLDAATALAVADRAAPLDPADLDRLATALYLTGDDTASIGARTRAHQGFLQRSEPIGAARSAFWLAFCLFNRPDQQAQAAGWLARARRLLDDCGQDCVEQGFVLCASAFQQVGAGDLGAAHASFQTAAEIGARFRNADLVALARHGEGRALLRLNRTGDGLAMLDEVMVAVTCGEVAPMVAGVVYCSVISACHDLFDLRRATEWTTALTAWCDAHPAMVPFRGHCLIRRSELLQLHGAWREALDETERARARLVNPAAQLDAGITYYQLGELYRLRGEFSRAEELYRQANQAGRTPQPGLALLRLIQGQTDAAGAAIRNALQVTRGVRARAQVLRAAVEILLAARDLSAARSAAAELEGLAGDLGAPFLRAASAQGSGAIALAADDASGAIALLRDAWNTWREIDAPYEIARVRELLGRAYRGLGDEDGAQMELEAAEEAFDRLGAAPDAARAAALLASTPPRIAAGLTGREVEVLRLIAAGKTNRAIATELAISEKTVARHVSNIFTKLDLSSRSAATAYAYNNKLV